jgi:hypothetical protein
MRAPSLTDRLRVLEPRLVDALIALALAGLIELQFLWGDHPGSSRMPST